MFTFFFQEQFIQRNRALITAKTTICEIKCQKICSKLFNILISSTCNSFTSSN